MARTGRIRGVIGRIIELLRGQRRREPTRWRWAYRCTWIDPRTGEEVADTYQTVIEDSPTNYQRAARDARRAALAARPEEISPGLPRGRNLLLRCRRVGDIIGLP